MSQRATDEITRLLREVAALEVTGDLETWIGYFADDAVLQPAGEPAVVGI